MLNQRRKIAIIACLLLIAVAGLYLFFTSEWFFLLYLRMFPREAKPYIGNEGDGRIYEAFLKDTIHTFQEDRDYHASHYKYVKGNMLCEGYIHKEYSDDILAIYKEYFGKYYSTVPDRRKPGFLYTMPPDNHDPEMLKLLEREYEKSDKLKLEIADAIYFVDLPEGIDFLVKHIDDLYVDGDYVKDWRLQALIGDSQNNPENLKLICESLDNLNEKARMEVEKILKSKGVSCDEILGSTKEGESEEIPINQLIETEEKL